MTMTMSVYDFRNAFLSSSERKDQFSLQALSALFEYLEEVEEDCGEEIEFDMIAICREYREYDTALEAAESYGFVADDDLDDDGKEDAAESYLLDSTTLISFSGGVIIENF